MSELVVQTQEAITAKMRLELMQSNYQQVQDLINSLEYTEDNILQIQNAIGNVNGLRKVIEEIHKKGKAPSLEEGRKWDAAKKETLIMVENLVSKPQAKLRELAAGIDKRRREAEAEEKRKKDIQEGIKKTILILTDKIAAAKDTNELVTIEKLIGSQKSQKAKLQEFFDDFVKQLDGLTPIIKDQKKKIAALEKELKKNGESEKAQQLRSEIEENKFTAQETGINSIINAPSSGYAQEVLPTVKAKRSVWKYEVVNIKEVVKKSPELTSVVINDDAVKEKLDGMKTGILKGKVEHIENGIRFYLEQTY